MSLVIWEIRSNFALMEQLSASITIASHLKGSVFPNHTDPEFEITGGFVDGMSGIMAVAYAPLIRTEEKEQWEEYALAHQDWIETSAYLNEVYSANREALHDTIMEHEHDYRRLQETNESISKEIYRWEDGLKVPDSSAPGTLIAPLWQVSPAHHGAVNENFLADERMLEEYGMMRRAEHTVMSLTKINDLVSPSSSVLSTAVSIIALQSI
jgi:hypothetical protein